MTVAEQIIHQVQTLPEAVQAEILDFVQYLKSKMEKGCSENVAWSDLSLTNAMRDMESEPSAYTLDDIKESL